MKRENLNRVLLAFFILFSIFSLGFMTYKAFLSLENKGFSFIYVLFIILNLNYIYRLINLYITNRVLDHNILYTFLVYQIVLIAISGYSYYAAKSPYELGFLIYNAAFGFLIILYWCIHHSGIYEKFIYQNVLKKIKKDDKIRRGIKPLFIKKKSLFLEIKNSHGSSNYKSAMGPWAIPPQELTEINEVFVFLSGTLVAVYLMKTEQPFVVLTSEKIAHPKLGEFLEHISQSDINKIIINLKYENIINQYKEYNIYINGVNQEKFINNYYITK